MHRLDLENDIDELAKLDPWIDQIARDLDASDKVSYALRLCLSEIATNILLYGGPENHGVRITVDRRKGAIVVRIEDDGYAFDPVKFEPVPLVTDIEMAPVGGHGLRLVRQFSNSMRYERSDGFNRLELTFAV